MEEQNIALRFEVRPGDEKTVEDMIRSTGFFRDDEIEVATDLVKQRLAEGPSCGYEFVFAEIDNKPVAYTCYGSIPCSLVSFDLYWIVTHNHFRFKGLGSLVLKETEKRVGEAGGHFVYIETSSKELYKPTQQFYLKNGYEQKALFEDFYEIGDGKIVYAKKLAQS
ncbi:MAG: N-acetyltransferase [Bacteroidetes bacterium HGW-Bacteroidetes-6]|jgi:GNAT superfamily N-acetyltransferase|nr:MAG: N-acetyltransferase [Bacteroidetes bacterium HGW-Bacteroidetes-6]